MPLGFPPHFRHGRRISSSLTASYQASRAWLTHHRTPSRVRTCCAFQSNDDERAMRIWLRIASAEKAAKSLGKLTPTRQGADFDRFDPFEPWSNSALSSVNCAVGCDRLRQVSGDPGSLKNNFVFSFTPAIRRSHLSRGDTRDYRLHTHRRLQAVADVPMSCPFMAR